MSRFNLGYGFRDAVERSQELDYGETLGKRKKPWAAKGFTFPEVQAFHQETLPPSDILPPGGPGGPLPPVGDPCAGRVLRPKTQITIPCGEKDIPIEIVGNVGDVTIHWPDGTSGTDSMGTIEECPDDDFITIPVTDSCPGYSTITIWLEACPCSGLAINSCGPDVLYCGQTLPCSSVLSPGFQQFTSSGGSGTITWSIEGTGWSVDSTGMVTIPACGSGSSKAVLTATDSNCCTAALDLGRLYALAISCTSPPCGEITKSSSKTYSVTGANGTVTWSVTGTGATISQSGTLTTDATACGMLEIQVTDECGGCGSLSVRVTNGGAWCNVANDYYSCSCGCGISLPSPNPCYVYAGDTRYTYYTYANCCGGPSCPGDCPAPESPCSTSGGDCSLWLGSTKRVWVSLKSTDKWCCSCPCP